MIKSVLLSVWLFPIIAFSQQNVSVLNVERQIQFCQSCVPDTNKFDDGSMNILYNMMVGDSVVQKGYKSFNIIDSALTLLELVWRDSNVWYSFMFNSTSSIYMSNLTIIDISKTITYFYENGKIARIENYNFKDRLDGWSISFDENGIIAEKNYYLNGKKSNKKPCGMN